MIGIDTHIEAADVLDTELSAHLRDGRTISAPLSWFPKLLEATSEERQHRIISDDGASLHWPKLGLWICIEDLLGHYSPSVRYLKTASFDEEFLRCLDAVT